MTLTAYKPRGCVCSSGSDCKCRRCEAALFSVGTTPDGAQILHPKCTDCAPETDHTADDAVAYVKYRIEQALMDGHHVDPSFGPVYEAIVCGRCVFCGMKVTSCLLPLLP